MGGQMSERNYTMIRGKLVTNEGFPRRSNVTDMTPEELQLRECIHRVEELGAHPLLTETVVLLAQAKEKLADFLDAQIDAKA